MGSDNLQPTGKVSALVPEYELVFLIWYDPPRISMWRWSNPVISCSLLICAVCGLFFKFFFYYLDEKFDQSHQIICVCWLTF